MAMTTTKCLLQAASVALTLGLIATPSPAEAQRAGKVWRLGFLGTSVSGDDPRIENFRQFREGLRERGYVETSAAADASI